MRNDTELQSKELLDYVHNYIDKFTRHMSINIDGHVPYLSKANMHYSSFIYLEINTT